MRQFFQNPPDGYCSEIAFALAHASRLAYPVPSDDQTGLSWPELVEQEFQSIGLLDYRTFDTDHTQAIGTFDPQNRVAVVAFRGTEPREIIDVLTDLDARKADFHGGTVHRGFLRAWERIRDDVLDFIPAGYRVWFTGHSLGGALATLAAASAHYSERYGLNVAGLYTFGSPRVMNWGLAARLNRDLGGKVHRLTNNCDIVPRVPFPLPDWLRSVIASQLSAWVHPAFDFYNQFPGGFRHVGKHRHFDVNGQHLEGLNFWKLEWDRIRGYFRGFLKPGIEGVRDHQLSEYILRVEGELPAAD